MAELILTDEERRHPFWGDLDDASLGKAVRAIGLFLDSCPNDKEQGWNLALKAGILGVCGRLAEANAETGEYVIQGLTSRGVEVGSWRATFQRLSGEEAKREDEDKPFVKMTIRAEGMTWRQRLETVWAYFWSAATSVFLGRFALDVYKYHRITSIEENGVGEV